MNGDVDASSSVSVDDGEMLLDDSDEAARDHDDDNGTRRNIDAASAVADGDYTVNVSTVRAAPFDIETYAANYVNHGKTMRLLFISERCAELRLPCLISAMEHVKATTFDHRLYVRLHRDATAIATSAAANAGRQNIHAVNGVSEPTAVPTATDALQDDDVMDSQPSPPPPDLVTTQTAHTEAATTTTPPPIQPLDGDWITCQGKKAALRHEKLDNVLKAYKSNSIKESIRRGNDDLAAHLLAMGQLEDAFQCYTRSRDYCTTARHILTMCGNIVRVAIYLRKWGQVEVWANKALASPDLAAATAAAISSNTSGNFPTSSTSPDAGGSSNSGAQQQRTSTTSTSTMTSSSIAGGRTSFHPHSMLRRTSITSTAAESAEMKAENLAMLTRMHCAHGLADLGHGRYREAADHFLQADLDHATSLSAYVSVSPGDVAVYATVCAMATMSRHELHAALLHSTPAAIRFRSFLDLDGRLRDMVHQFCESRFATSLSILDALRDAMFLDVFLAPHVGHLMVAIRNRAMVQYVTPFVALRLTDMATTFSTSVDGLIAELTSLIWTGKLPTASRIDQRAKTLHIAAPDESELTMKRISELAKTMRHDTWRAAWCMTLARAGCSATRPASKQSRVPPTASQTVNDQGGVNDISPIALYSSGVENRVPAVASTIDDANSMDDPDADNVESRAPL